MRNKFRKKTHGIFANFVFVTSTATAAVVNVSINLIRTARVTQYEKVKNAAMRRDLFFFASKIIYNLKQK